MLSPCVLLCEIFVNLAVKVISQLIILHNLKIDNNTNTNAILYERTNWSLALNQKKVIRNLSEVFCEMISRKVSY